MLSLIATVGAGAAVDLERVALLRMPAVDVQALLAEDAANLGRKDVPLRLGFPMSVDVSPANDGTWDELADGGRRWRLRIESPGALWIVPGFDLFRLPSGAVLRIYDGSGTTLLDRAGAEDVREHGELWFAPLPGDALLIELEWPAALRDQLPALHLGTVSHGYKSWADIGQADDETDEVEALGSGSCNIDVNCPLGADWQNQKRGVVRLLSGGSAFCTGSLITNTAQDCRNYILTARHCGAGTGTTFQFNYERPNCGSGTAPTSFQLTGAFLRAQNSASDFTLLEMDDPIPENFNVYYSGWSRSTTPATQVHTIHHPDGDVKKISFSDDALTLDTACGGSTHWRIDNWEQGTTEPGSSGSPLFDENRRIVGQLHCGTASCSSITYDAYGRFDLSWTGGGSNSTRLSNWLDPGSTGVTVIDGIDYTVCLTPQPRLTFQGRTFSDTAGNGNGIAEPGETLQVAIDLRNEGTLAATSVAGVLSTTTGLVTVSDPNASWPDLGPGDTKSSLAPHFSLALDPALPCGTTIALRLDVTAAQAPGAWNANFTIPTGTPQTTTSFSDNMESGINGWTTASPTGSNPWAQTTVDASSPVTSWRVIDVATTSQSILTSPVISALPANSTLRFRHRYNLESDSTAYDGGVLEYSANGGAWTDAGSLITEGGYTGTLSTCCSNPLGGRQAWSGNSGSWITTRANLASLAGQNVQFRWRFGTDSSVSDEGWFVDDVAVDVTSFECLTNLAPPGEASDPQGPGDPLRIKVDGSSYLLSWSSPMIGGPVSSYKLYRSPIGTGVWTPSCEADLGSGTSAAVGSLSTDHAFIVVARNSAGEGPAGYESSGAPRPAATGGAICP